MDKQKLIEDIILSTKFTIQEPHYTSSSKIEKFVKQSSGFHTHNPSLSQWRFRNNHILKDYLIWYPFKVEGMLILNGTTYKVAPDSISILAPGSQVTLTDKLLKNLHVYSMRFNITSLFQVFRYVKLPINVKCRGLAIKKAFEVLFRHEKSEDTPLIHRKIFLLTIMETLIKENHLDLEEAFFLKDNKYLKFQEMLKLIQDNINKKIYIQQLSDYTLIDKTTITKLFHKYFDCTPIQYINSQKIEASKKLMIKGKSILETSSEMGFPDVYTFSKVFKKIEGKTPGSFVKDVKEGEFLFQDILH